MQENVSISSDTLIVEIRANSLSSSTKKSAHNQRITLKPAEAVRRTPISKIRNQNRYQYYEFRIQGSILGNVLLYIAISTAWATFLCVLYFIYEWKSLAVSNFIVSILSIVVGLVLVFRTNSAYDRYWEARKLWGTLKTHIRNLARFIFITPVKDSSLGCNQKMRAASLNLLAALPIAIKHQLRQENGIYYEDLYPLLCHLPEYAPGHEEVTVEKIPLEISFQISHLIAKMRASEQVDAVMMGQMIASLSGCMDVLSNMERIRSSPLPLAYSIHLRQTVLLYIFTLPFQLLVGLGWATIPVVAFSTFTLLGIDSIGTEIEQPFGYDANDLRLDMFCDDIKHDLALMLNRKGSLDSSMWETPVDLRDLPSMYDLRKFSPSNQNVPNDNLLSEQSKTKICCHYH